MLSTLAINSQSSCYTDEKKWIPGMHMVEVDLRPPHATNLFYTQTQMYAHR